VKAQVAAEFTELRAISADELVYIKEDLIIPHVRRSLTSLSFFLVAPAPHPAAHARPHHFASLSPTPRTTPSTT